MARPRDERLLSYGLSIPDFLRRALAHHPHWRAARSRSASRRGRCGETMLGSARTGGEECRWFERLSCRQRRAALPKVDIDHLCNVPSLGDGLAVKARAKVGKSQQGRKRELESGARARAQSTRQPRRRSRNVASRASSTTFSAVAAAARTSSTAEPRSVASAC